MADASFLQPSFAGGEWSKAMQGRTDRPDYRTALNVCLNAMPLEQGAWQRRTGFAHCGPTRGGAPGRVIAFDFKQAAPYNIELTNGHLRFWAGTQIATTNDDATIVAISAATPAVVQVAAAVTWASGDQGVFRLLAATCPLLQNRTFALTKVDTTHFSLADAITGTAIDGSTLGAPAAGATLARVLDIVAPYIGGAWTGVRAVPTDIPTAQGTTPGTVLLSPSIAPQVLQVVAEPVGATFGTFTFGTANLKDGPYLDPVAGGTLVTPSATIGIVTMNLSFAAYDATRAYAIGDYVTSSSVNYKSLTDANLNNTPASSATNWAAVSGADAVGPNGFQASDVGRMVRLMSAPALWAAGTTYAAGATIAYGNPGGGEAYYKSLVGSNTGNVPGTDATNWTIAVSVIRWTWGKITSLSNIIDRLLAGSVLIGDMTGGGGLAAAFDGLLSQAASACAEKTASAGDGTALLFGSGTQITLSSYAGKNYSGASNQKIQQAIVYPSNDNGAWVVTGTGGGSFSGDDPLHALVYGSDFSVTTIYRLRAKASAPANSSDGTLLGSSAAAANFGAQQTITSGDQSTAWAYVWIEQVTTVTFTASDVSSYAITNAVAEVSLFNPPGSGTSQGFNLQILGDALPNTNAIRTWRLGVFSTTTGWPICGTYHEGRLLLGGVVGNRWDASKSNDPFNFAPTNPDGSVGDASAIAYRFNAPDVNPIFWMSPDQQGVVMGTQAGEWLVQATTANAILTPTTVQAHRYTTNGCANIEPARTNHTLVVVQRFRRAILEFFADVFSGKFSAQNILHKNEPLSKPYIAEVRYQQELVPVVWARMTDGSLIGVTYKRDSLVSSQEAQAGAHRHVLGSGRTVESITVGASPDGNLDALAMVTNDPAIGVRHVEMKATEWEEDDALAGAFFLDDAIRPSSTAISAPAVGAPYGGITLYGLWAHNGKTVQVFAGGLDCGDPGEGKAFADFTVASGAVFVPFGDGVSAGSGAGRFTGAAAAAAAAAGTILVGFTYTSDGQVVPPIAPAESGARNGPAGFKTQRSARYGVKVYDTAGLSIGTDFAKLLPALFKTFDGAGPAIAPGVLAQGNYRDSLADDYSYSSKLCWRITRPWPANIAAIGAFPHTQDV